MPGKALVLDANILIRAVLGIRVRPILEFYCEYASFYIPVAVLEEAKEHLAALAVRRGGDPDVALRLLNALTQLTEVLEEDAYLGHKIEASELLGNRDPEDWPVLAAALAIGCPIWSEDTDFFGCGVAVWTSDRVERYLRR